MSVYLDASVLVPLFVTDPFSLRAQRFLEANTSPLVISDFAGLELASVLARRARTGELTKAEAREGFAHFDLWRARALQQERCTADDVAAATALIRSLDSNIGAPDALHLALVRRLDAGLATFDAGLSAAAKALRLSVVTG